jgi:hypothetical protein
MPLNLFDPIVLENVCRRASTTELIAAIQKLQEDGRTSFDKGRAKWLAEAPKVPECELVLSCLISELRARHADANRSAFKNRKPIFASTEQAKDFISQIDAAFRAAFPKSYIKVSAQTDDTVRVVFGLVDDINKLPNKIRDNDPAFSTWFVSGFGKGEALEAKIIRGGSFMVKPAPGSHNAMDSVKLGWRGKTGTAEQVVKHFTDFIAKAKGIIKQNVDNAYGDPEQITVYKSHVTASVAKVRASDNDLVLATSEFIAFDGGARKIYAAISEMKRLVIAKMDSIDESKKADAQEIIDALESAHNSIADIVTKKAAKF